MVAVGEKKRKVGGVRGSVKTLAGKKQGQERRRKLGKRTTRRDFGWHEKTKPNRSSRPNRSPEKRFVKTLKKGAGRSRRGKAR